MSNGFQMAAERALARIGESAWSRLSLRDQAKAIYAELRAADAGQDGPPLPGTGSGSATDQEPESQR